MISSGLTCLCFHSCSLTTTLLPTFGLGKTLLFSGRARRYRARSEDRRVRHSRRASLLQIANDGFASPHLYPYDPTAGTFRETFLTTPPPRRLLKCIVYGPLRDHRAWIHLYQLHRSLLVRLFPKPFHRVLQSLIHFAETGLPQL